MSDTTTEEETEASRGSDSGTLGGSAQDDPRRTGGMDSETIRDLDVRLRTIEQNVATELGEQRQFRHDIRNWRTAVDGQASLFQSELLRQSERIGRLEQYQARHEAEYTAKLQQIGELSDIERQISERLSKMDEKLLARVESLEHKVNSLIIEKAVAKWLVGLLAGGVVLIGNVIAHKLGWL